MKEKILETIKKYNLIETKDKVVIGVSGGPDSMTLLNALLEIKKEKKISLTKYYKKHLLTKLQQHIQQTTMQKLF